jgi:hypothetical protein
MTSRSLALSLVFSLSIGCGPVGAGPPSGEASAVGSGSGPGSGVGGGGGGDLGTGGSQACGTALDLEGCACVVGDAKRSCYPGPAEQAGKGVCVMGEQECVPGGNAEISSAIWGACIGAGEPQSVSTACDDTKDEDRDCDGLQDPGCGCHPADVPVWTAWEQHDFASAPSSTPCNGERWVRFDSSYGVWVGAVLCSPHAYKLFLSDTEDGTYYEIGDTAGNGQDHCELVSPSFTIPDEDDVTSGGCPACGTGPMVLSEPEAVYSRGYFGQCFAFQPAWPANTYSVQWYECGVTIP